MKDLMAIYHVNPRPMSYAYFRCRDCGVKNCGCDGERAIRRCEVGKGGFLSHNWVPIGKARHLFVHFRRRNV